jgi:hypothetical protein
MLSIWISDVDKLYRVHGLNSHRLLLSSIIVLKIGRMVQAGLRSQIIELAQSLPWDLLR